MATLYLDHRGLQLRAEAGALLIHGADERPRSIPMSLLERVVIQGETSLSTSLLGRLAEAGVGVLVLSGRQSWRTACLLGRPHRDVQIRLAQYRLALDAASAAAWARLWVSGKLRAQIRTLAGGLEQRPDRRHQIESALSRLKRLAPGLPEAAAVASIRGLEGAAAAAYFPALAALFAPALGFQTRNRRPPRDPVNAALSLAYTLLHFEAVRAAQTAGLDPLLGCLHAPAFGRESLACDLIEPLRPRVDSWLWGLFRQRRLRLEDFVHDKGACLLHKSGRRRFYEAWEDAAGLYRLPLRAYCRLLVARLRAVQLPLPPEPPSLRDFGVEESWEQPEEADSA